MNFDGYPFFMKPISLSIFIAFATRLVHISTAYCTQTPKFILAFWKAYGMDIAAPDKFPFESLKKPSTVLKFHPYQL